MDRKVVRMSYEAQGVYMRLLCYCWKDSDEQCWIRDDDQEIANILGLTPRKWKKYRT